MTRIVGAAKDLERARIVLGSSHDYISPPSQIEDILTSDVVVGGKFAAGGVPWDVPNRIAGETLEDTEWALIQYAMRCGIFPDVSRLTDRSIVRLAKVGYLSKSLKKMLEV